MHTAPAIHVPADDDYNAPRKYVLVLSCMDARLLDDLVAFLDNDNLTNRYYHITMAGASLGLTDRWKSETVKTPMCPSDFNHWKQVFRDEFLATVALTNGGVTDVYIIHHADCGAFRAYFGHDASTMTPTHEESIHKEYAHALLNQLKTDFCDYYNPHYYDDKTKKDTGICVQKKLPNIYTFFQDLRGNVKLMDKYVNELGKDTCACYGCYCPNDHSVKKPLAKKGTKQTN